MESVRKFPDTVLINRSKKVFGPSEDTMRSLAAAGDVVSYLIAGRRVICSESVRCFILDPIRLRPSSGLQAIWMETFMATPSSFPLLIHINEVGEYFSFARSSAYRLREAGEIASINIGRSNFLIVQSVLCYIEREKKSQRKLSCPDMAG